ncbi:LOB domain-containing protein 20 [Camellia sinensis]|uniref:LOB domain-containing protein n=1 Tax=Camellia sinensis var. sinensis TaxID=542762 RepID=A0A4S4EK36_CAMSN|nr:LOB domain-containing protein 20 [Camellia sinensis]THG16562.1 hypothetical protein TEA_028777 [Camellia sinensis var. sinensis]
MAEPQSDGTSEGRRKSSGKRSTTAIDAGVAAAVPLPTAPCGACKFLRRKCISGCIFAPHFGSDQGAARFAAVHKVFGASNVSKLLLHIPMNRRHDAVVTISYEAQARLSDPVYGCVSTILALQQQVASLQAELAMVQTQLINSRLAVANAFHNTHQLQPHQQQQQQHIALLQPGPGPAYSNNSSSTSNNHHHHHHHHLLNNNNNLIINSSFDALTCETTAPSSHSFEPLQLSSQCPPRPPSSQEDEDQDQEEDEEDSRNNPAVSFAHHILRSS